MTFFLHDFSHGFLPIRRRGKLHVPIPCVSSVEEGEGAAPHRRDVGQPVEHPTHALGVVSFSLVGDAVVIHYLTNKIFKIVCTYFVQTSKKPLLIFSIFNI